MAKYRTSLVSAICELIGEYNLSVNETCQLMHINRKTFYKWRKEKPAFREAIDAACAEKHKRAATIPGEEKIIVRTESIQY